MVFINGRPHGRIQVSRGVKKGDPLSPVLFLLISDVQSSLLDNIHEKGIFEGFIVGRNSVYIFHLQFADATLIFCKDDGMVEILFKIIKAFEWQSG